MAFWKKPEPAPCPCSEQLAALINSVNRIETHCEMIFDRQAKLEKTIMNLAALIASLQTAVTNETTVEQSAITLLNGIPALIAAAVATATAAGATPAQLQALTDLQTQISTSSTALATAVTANTPAAPPTGN